MTSRCHAANAAFTFMPCAAPWNGSNELFLASRSEQPTGRCGLRFLYWICYEDGDEICNLDQDCIFPVAETGKKVRLFYV